MSKWRSYLARIGIFGVAGMVMYLLLQLLLAVLIIKNVLPENRVTGLQIIAGGMSAFLGGLLALKSTVWTPAAGLTGLCIVVLTAALGFVVYDGIMVNGNTVVRIGVMLTGGLLPTLLLKKKGRKRGKGRAQLHRAR